eukprot:gene74-3470_t
MEHLRKAARPEDDARVSAYLQQTVSLGALMSDFMSETAEAHKKFQQECSALTLKARRKLSQMQKHDNWQLNDLSPIMRACDALLSGTESQAFIHGKHGDNLLSHVEGINQSLKRREDMIHISLEHRDNLRETLAIMDKELAKLNKANDGAMHALNVSRRQSTTKVETSNSSPECLQEDPKKTSCTERSSARRMLDCVTGVLKEDNAYEFKRTAHNDLAEVLDALEDSHLHVVHDISNLFATSVHIQHDLYTEVLQQQTQLRKSIEECQMNADLGAWLQSASIKAPMPPMLVAFHPPLDMITEKDSIWREDVIICKKDSDTYVDEKTRTISRNVQKIATNIGQTRHFLEGALKLHDEYARNPQFGEADTIRKDMQCYHAQMAFLEGMPIDEACMQKPHFVQRQSSRSRKGNHHFAVNICADNDDYDYDDDNDDDDIDDDYDSDEWEVGSDEDCEGHQSRLIYGSEDARDAQVFAVAMFPFVAETHDQLTVKTDEILELLEWGSDKFWWKCKRDRQGGTAEVGLVSQTNLRAFVGDASKFARTLYTYEATNDQEVSFEADELVRIMKWNVCSGWSEGIVTNKRGLLPSLYITPLTRVQNA